MQMNSPENTTGIPEKRSKIESEKEPSVSEELKAILEDSRIPEDIKVRLYKEQKKS